jgi:chromosome segregation ATPase
MSTAGRVLVVLVALAMIPWIILFSLVYQLNENWGQEKLNVEKKIAETEQDNARIRADLDKMLGDIKFLQVNRDNQLTLLRSRLSDAEKRQTLAFEAQERMRLEIETLNVAIKAAQTSIERRTQEWQDTNKALADTRAAVQVLRQDVDAKYQQVEELRSRFLKVTQENRKQLRQAVGSGADAGRARIRSASLR